MKSNISSASLSLVFFLDANAKIFFTFPSCTNPSPSPVVTKGSHANACSLGKLNEPIDQIFGTDLPA